MGSIQCLPHYRRQSPEGTGIPYSPYYQANWEQQKGKFQKSEDIRKRFGRDVRVLQRDELIALLGKKTIEEEDKEERISEGRQPVLRRYISGTIKLRTHFKGKTVTARVKRDGTINYRGKIYLSPSQAAAAACKRRTCNGWSFWRYERAPGDWVPLNELRR